MQNRHRGPLHPWLQSAAVHPVSDSHFALFTRLLTGWVCAPGRRTITAMIAVADLNGITQMQALVAEHAPAAWADLSVEEAAGQVVVGIETDRGPWVLALLAAGYQVYGINPLSSARYRERYSTSGAKSDAGDAHVLAEIVRLDRAHHRQVAGDSDPGEAVKLLARPTRRRSGNGPVMHCDCAQPCVSSIPLRRRRLGSWPQPTR